MLSAAWHYKGSRTESAPWKWHLPGNGNLYAISLQPGPGTYKTIYIDVFMLNLINKILFKLRVKRSF